MIFPYASGRWPKTTSKEEYCHFVGNGILRLVERALPEPLRTPDMSGETILKIQ